MTGRVDVHPHLWPEPLLAALSRRARPPVIRRSRGGWVLRIAGEPEDLLAADHAGASALGDRLPARTGAGLARPGRLDEDFVGLRLPARALCGPDGAARCAPLLSTLDERGSPLSVHPGPAPWSAPPSAGQDSPDRWPALTSYVAQIHAAWPGARTTPGVFLDTSSYGPRAIAAVAAVTGWDHLVHGSGRPVIDPARQSLGGAGLVFDDAVAARLFAPQEVLA
jgi:6-methylsalicylate decarboxylase